MAPQRPTRATAADRALPTDPLEAERWEKLQKKLIQLADRFDREAQASSARRRGREAYIAALLVRQLATHPSAIRFWQPLLPKFTPIHREEDWPSYADDVTAVAKEFGLRRPDQWHNVLFHALSEPDSDDLYASPWLSASSDAEDRVLDPAELLLPWDLQDWVDRFLKVSVWLEVWLRSAKPDDAAKKAVERADVWRTQLSAPSALLNPARQRRALIAQIKPVVSAVWQQDREGPGVLELRILGDVRSLKASGKHALDLPEDGVWTGVFATVSGALPAHAADCEFPSSGEACKQFVEKLARQLLVEVLMPGQPPDLASRSGPLPPKDAARWWGDHHLGRMRFIDIARKELGTYQSEQLEEETQRIAKLVAHLRDGEPD